MKKLSLSRLVSPLIIALFLAGCSGGSDGGVLGLGESTGSRGGLSDTSLDPDTGTVQPQSGRVIIEIPLLNLRAVKSDVASFLIVFSQGGEEVLSQEFTRAEVEASGQQVVFDDIPAGEYQVRILYLSASGTELGFYDQTIVVGPEGVALIDNPGYQNSKPDFKTVRFLAGNAMPGYFATADFNEDGHRDIIASESGASSAEMYLYLGTGDGYFEEAVEMETPFDGASFVSAGDLNGDDHQDIAIANGDSVVVYLGVGDGSFGVPLVTGLNGGTGPTSVRIANLDDDSEPDLVTSNHTSNSVSVLLGRGDGTFETADNYGTGIEPTDVLPVDVDGDGDLDLVVANLGGSELSVWLGDGLGAFTAGADLAVGAEPGYLTSQDINGDTVDDLVSVNASGSLSLLLSDGTGGRQATQTYAVGVYPVSASFGDVNEDGRPDLLVANFGGTDFSLLLGNQPTATQAFQSESRIPTSKIPNFAGLVDLNEDTHLDIVSCNFNGAVLLALGGGDGTFEVPPPSVTGGLRPACLRSSDIDSDGDLDLLALNYSGGSINVARNNGSGAFSVITTLGVGQGGREMQVADLNEDGHPDIVAGTDRLDIFFGVGNGTFTRAPEIHNQRVSSLVVVDFNNDGNLDIGVAGFTQTQMRIYLGNGAGGFTNTSNPNSTIQNHALVSDDYNGDGISDLASLNLNDSVSVMLGNGDGTFGNPRLVGFPDSGGGSVEVYLTSADLNGDGESDLLVADIVDGDVVVAHGAGDGTFSTPVVYAFEFGIRGVTCQDVNGDGLVDLLCNTGRPGVAVRLQTDDGSFELPSYFLAEDTNVSVVAADFNADGGVDLAVGNQGDTVSVLLAR